MFFVNVAVRREFERAVEDATKAFSDGFQFWQDIMVYLGFLHALVAIVDEYRRLENDQIINGFIDALEDMDEEYNIYGLTAGKLKESISWWGILPLKVVGVWKWIKNKESFYRSLRKCLLSRLQ